MFELVKQSIKMEGRMCYKFYLVLCLSIFLTLAVISETIIIISLASDNDKFAELERTILIATCVGVANEIVAQIVGIVAISFNHYYGCLAYTIYQVISFILLQIIFIIVVIKVVPIQLTVNIAGICRRDFLIVVDIKNVLCHQNHLSFNK